MERFLRKIYKLKNNKKGMSSIEMVISVMVFLMLLCLLLDLLVLSWKFAVVSQTNTQVARIAGIQGGIRSSTPSGYPGGSSNYITATQMSGIIADKFGSAGIKKSEYDFRAGSGRLGGNTTSQTPLYDYKNQFDTTVTLNYEWKFISNFIPGNLKSNITSKRTTISEWKYDYRDW